MLVFKREITGLFRIAASCLTAAALIFFISSLSGEDLLKNNDEVKKIAFLMDEINHELNGAILQRVSQLGEIPEKNPFRKFYCVELAKEVHELANLTEKQRMLFDTYNVRNFEVQLKRLMNFTENSDVQSLMDEVEIVKRELKNSANLLDKKRDRFIRQRTAYIIMFCLFWVILYLYYSRGIILKKSEHD